jgi:F-box/leucine-rich repeat protein 14
VAEVANEPPPAAEVAPEAPEVEVAPAAAVPSVPQKPKTPFEQLTAPEGEDDVDLPTTFEGWLGLVGNGTNRFTRIVLEHPEAPEKLTALNLSKLRNVNDEGTEGLERMTSLERLVLDGAGTDAMTLSRASRLPALKVISIAGSVVRKPLELGDNPFPAVERLTASGAQLNRDALLAIARMHELRVLEIPQAGLTNEAVMLLKPLMKLEEVDFSRNVNLGDAGLTELVNAKQIRTLNLDMTGVRGPGLLFLAQARVFDNLTDLSLMGTTLADEMAPALMAMGRLERLDLRQTTIRDRGLSLIPQLKALRHLSLENCKDLTVNGFIYLKANSTLESLNVSRNNQLNDPMLPVLASMKALRKLNLIDTGFTPEGVQRLREVLPLTEIEFSEN